VIEAARHTQLTPDLPQPESNHISVRLFSTTAGILAQKAKFKKLKKVKNLDCGFWFWFFICCAIYNLI